MALLALLRSSGSFRERYALSDSLPEIPRLDRVGEFVPVRECHLPRCGTEGNRRGCRPAGYRSQGQFVARLGGSTASKAQRSGKRSRWKFRHPRGAQCPEERRVSIADGGRTGATQVPALKLMASLPANVPARVSINERTTIGSVWPNAQLLAGEKLQGTAVGLAVGRAQVPNLVDVGTGSFGRTVLDRGESD